MNRDIAGTNRLGYIDEKKKKNKRKRCFSRKKR